MVNAHRMRQEYTRSEESPCRYAEKFFTAFRLKVTTPRSKTLQGSEGIGQLLPSVSVHYRIVTRPASHWSRLRVLVEVQT